MSWTGADALPALVVVTGLGAFLMCVLVLRYGTGRQDGDPESDRRALAVLRAGHGVAAVGFAIATGLGVLALREGVPPGATDGPPAAAVAAGPRPPSQATARSLEPSPPAAPGPGGVGSAGRGAAASSIPAREGPAARGTDPGTPAARNTSARPARDARADEAAGLPPLERGVPSSNAEPALPPLPSRPGEGEPVVNERARGEEGVAAALPAATLGVRRVRVTIRGVRLDVETHRDGWDHLYLVRLADAGGRPVGSAAITLYGRAADGSPVAVTAEPDGAEPGVYRARVAQWPEPIDLRLRVARQGRHFEISLGEPVSWE
jgi:hypothetical protein